jgi:acetyl-CoA acetyltransferase
MKESSDFLRSGTDFKDFLTYDLARMALKGVIDKANLPAREIEHVLFGCVLNEPRTSNVAREALIGANLPLEIPAHTIAMACISGSQAIAQAAVLIATGLWARLSAFSGRTVPLPGFGGIRAGGLGNGKSVLNSRPQV